jgi:DNA-binding NtrC family response regulator
MTRPTEILVIEDDAITREALIEWLETAGYAVREAADARAGIAAVSSAAPARVLTDIHVPGLGGAAIITVAKRPHPGIPVIAISGLFNWGDGIDADAAPAPGHWPSRSNAASCSGR